MCRRALGCGGNVRTASPALRTRRTGRRPAVGHHSEMDAAATCEWYMYKARKRRRAKPASVTREETKLQECEAVLAQVLGVPVGALSRLELCNTGQEAELRRRALDDPDVIVPLILAFRHAVDARKHRAWWSSEAAAADGVHDWFRPEPQLVWRLKLMRALCSPLSHPACARAAAAAELPAMLLEVPPPTSCTSRLCTTAPKPLTPVSMYVCTSASRLPPLCAAACTFPHASARTSTSTSACRCCGLATRWCEERGGPLRRATLSAASPPSPPTPTASSSSTASYRSCALLCAGTRAHAMPMRHVHAPPRATPCSCATRHVA